MKLSRTEFDAAYNENRLRIALIGMSNIGKSYTAMRLATRYDFQLIEVDKIIWESLDQGSMDDFARWQGQPYSEGYAAREARSIALETQATAQALDNVQGNAILDTTGSVIYTDEATHKALAKDWYIIHIKASASALKYLKTQYFNQPKPLIWREYFQCAKGQDPKDAILESYPKLLAARAKTYASLADGTIESDVILDASLSIEDIFAQLKPST